MRSLFGVEVRVSDICPPNTIILDLPDCVHTPDKTTLERYLQGDTKGIAVLLLNEFGEVER